MTSSAGSAVVERKLQFTPASSVWTGREIIALGAHGLGRNAPTLAVGFVPATGEWRDYPAPPVPEPLSGGRVVWDGSDVIVVGVSCRDRTQPGDEELVCDPGRLWAGALRPGTGRWRALPIPDGADPASLRAGLWGTSVGAVGSVALFDVGGHTRAWTGRSWADLGPVGARSCVTDTHLVRLVPSATGGADQPVIEVRAVPEGEWRVVEPIPTSARPETLEVGCGDEDVLVVALTPSLGQGWKLGSTGTWTSVGAAPQELLREGAPTGVAPERWPSMTTLFSYRAWTGRDFIWWQEQRSIATVDLTQRPLPPGVFPGVGLRLSGQPAEWSTIAAGPPGLSAAAGAGFAWSDGMGYALSPSLNQIAAIRYDPLDPEAVQRWLVRLSAEVAAQSGPAPRWVGDPIERLPDVYGP